MTVRAFHAEISFFFKGAQTDDGKIHEWLHVLHI